MAAPGWWKGPENLQARRLNIACTAPHLHRVAWRSVYGDHFHCATCKPAVGPHVVAETIDLDDEQHHPRTPPRTAEARPKKSRTPKEITA